MIKVTVREALANILVTEGSLVYRYDSDELIPYNWDMLTNTLHIVISPETNKVEKWYICSRDTNFVLAINDLNHIVELTNPLMKFTGVKRVFRKALLDALEEPKFSIPTSNRLVPVGVSPTIIERCLLDIATYHLTVDNEQLYLRGEGMWFSRSGKRIKMYSDNEGTYRSIFRE